MSIFALIQLQDITSRLRIYKLLINDTCEYDEFETQIREVGNLTSELNTIQTRIIEMAEGKLLPKEKFKDITPKIESIKEYEIKTKHLRVYMFHEEKTGRVIVFGGKKTTQPIDIKRFRRIKKEYFNQKNK